MTIHAVLAVVSLRQQAVTIDEYAHLPAGVSHWQKGTFFIYKVNPPLSKMLAALPVLFAEPEMDYSADLGRFPAYRYEWQFGASFMRANADRYQQLFLLGRYPMVFVSVLGGWLVFCWSRRLFGEAAGLIATALWAFCPHVLAFAQLITPDILSATVTVAACYTYWHWLLRPTWPKVLGVGVVLGLAELAKFTLLFLYPVWIVLWLAWQFSDGSRSTRKELGQLVVIFGLSVVVLNLGYGFGGSFRRLGDLAFGSQALQAEHLRDRPIGTDEHGTTLRRYQLVKENRFQGTWLGALPVPLPEQYVSGIDLQWGDFETPPMESYLRGEVRQRGWWYYYLYGLGVKLPMGTLLLIMLAVVMGLADRRFRQTWPTELALVLPAFAVLLLVSSQTGFNHHLRYVLPMLPLLFIALSRVGRLFDSSIVRRGAIRAILGGVVVLCLVWNAVAALRVHPHHLSYFNELAGGPDHGGEHLINSSLDWGQDLLFLKGWMEEHPEVSLQGLAYWNFVDPSVAGIDLNAPPLGPTELYEDYADERAALKLGPQPGWYAVSANLVYGIGGPYRNEFGNREWAPKRGYLYFQRFQPVAKAGYSIFIYHISLEEANEVRRELGLPQL